jgi:hypothetical protein
MPMPDYLSAKQVAGLIGCRPRDVSDLLYWEEVHRNFCPLVGKQRLIPVTYLPAIVRSLKRRGRKLSPLWSEGNATVFEAEPIDEASSNR